MEGRRILRPLALLAAVAILLAACGGDETGATTTRAPGTTTATTKASGEVKTGPGVDSATKTIKVGEITDLSGPVAVIGTVLTEGHRVFFKALNDAGGINGWKVELVEKDTTYNPQTHKQVYEEIKGQVAMFAQSLGTPTTAAILDDIEADKIMVSPASLGSQLAREQYLMLIGTPYRMETMNALQWITKDKGAKEGSKVGIIYQDDEYGQDALGGFEKAAAAFKFDVVAKLTYGRTDKDFTAQIQQLKDAGAEFVHLTVTPSQLGPMLATAAKLQYAPVWTADGPVFDPSLLTTANLPIDLFKNLFIVTGIATWGEDVPGMTKMLEDVKKYKPDQVPNGFFVFGYTQASVVSKLLEQAVKNGDLSREGMYRAFTELKDIDTGGLLPKLSYGPTPNDRVPSRQSRVYVVDNDAPAKTKAITDYFVSDIAKTDSF